MFLLPYGVIIKNEYRRSLEVAAWSGTAVVWRIVYRRIRESDSLVLTRFRLIISSLLATHGLNFNSLFNKLQYSLDAKHTKS